MNKRIAQLVAALGVLTVMAAFLLPQEALAAPDAAGGSNPLTVLAKVFGLAIAAFGCGLAQGRAAAAALEGICRNPNAADKVFTPMLLSLAFIESLTIFTLVVVFTT